MARRKSRRGKSAAQRRQQSKMRTAAKRCKGRSRRGFQACMKRELRKR